ncbi:MAG: hypothetical protein OEX00_02845 [Gammaproteobacteria bacterium]|nr:hypothetical protein [Gammaproteobacteria bacterium]MDH5692613.1 hypothetical protein [Gammaproteobacteria bacterium]
MLKIYLLVTAILVCAFPLSSLADRLGFEDEFALEGKFKLVKKSEGAHPTGDEWDWKNTDLIGMAEGQAWAYYGVSYIDYTLTSGFGRSFGIFLQRENGLSTHGQIKTYASRGPSSTCREIEYVLASRCSNFETSFNTAELFLGYNIGKPSRPVIVSAGIMYSSGMNLETAHSTRDIASSIYVRVLSGNNFGLGVELTSGLNLVTATAMIEFGDLKGSAIESERNTIPSEKQGGESKPEENNMIQREPESSKTP